MNLVIPLALPLLKLMGRRDSLLMGVLCVQMCMGLVVFELVVLLHIFDMADVVGPIWVELCSSLMVLGNLRV